LSFIVPSLFFDFFFTVLSLFFHFFFHKTTFWIQSLGVWTDPVCRSQLQASLAPEAGVYENLERQP
jgi:hypothetical protein